MAEQIMWAVKSPAGIIFWESMRPTEREAQLAFSKSIAMWGHARECRYRCVRVKVMEVE